jgi:hypothetical protein
MQSGLKPVNLKYSLLLKAVLSYSIKNREYHFEKLL